MTNLSISNPFNREVIAQLPLQSAGDVESALARARALFDDRAGWLPAAQRISILEKTAQLMEQRVEELTKIALREGGKPYMDSRVEVLRAINGVRVAAGCISQLKGEQIPMGLNPASGNRLAYTMREPIGVVVSVSAFNHPLNLIVHQTATAIAAGCPVIVKPAPTTPMSCLNFVKLLQEAGLPDGWCQPMVCDNEAAEKLVTDSRVSFLSFIGSSRVGWMLRAKLAPGARCALEHGGAAPVIVDKDVDVAEIVPSLVKGGYYHAGQVCVSVQRVFVEQSRLDEVCVALTEKAKKLVVGDPADPKTEVGPLITPHEVDRVAQWVGEAVERGAKLLCGGKKISDTCYEPTVLLNPPADAKVSTLEIFGPVVCVYGYSDRNEAIRAANALSMHFQAAVFTKNIDVALDCVNRLDATAVMVNDNTAFRVDWMPFGGRDTSGLGMGGIGYSIDDMTRIKMMVLKSPVL